MQSGTHELRRTPMSQRTEPSGSQELARRQRTEPSGSHELACRRRLQQSGSQEFARLPRAATASSGTALLVDGERVGFGWQAAGRGLDVLPPVAHLAGAEQVQVERCLVGAQLL